MSPTDSRFELASGAFLEVEGDVVSGDLRPEFREAGFSNVAIGQVLGRHLSEAREDVVLSCSSDRFRLECIEPVWEADPERPEEDGWGPPEWGAWIQGVGRVSMAQHVARSIIWWLEGRVYVPGRDAFCDREAVA